MDKENNKYRYLEWKSPDEMHFSTMQWISELNFISDEHRFFEDMLKEYTMPIIESSLFSRTKELTGRLSESAKKLESLSAKVQDHNKRLHRLIENIDEPREGRVYKEEHKNLLKEVNSYSRDYKILKREIFEIVTQALKQQKQKRLLE